MLKKILLTILFIFFLASATSVQAAGTGSIIISEFVYDLDGADIDWVEVENQGGADLDLASLKLLVSNSTSNHAINNYSGSSILGSGDYGVIVVSSLISNYTSKWGNAGNIFTSSFTLSNAGGKIEINNGDKASPVDSVTYSSGDGAAGDGQSLSLISGSFSPEDPTPGEANVSGGGNNQDGTLDNNENTNTNPSPSQTEPKISAEIISKDTAIAKVPINFDVKVLGLNKEILTTGKFVWNFGDLTVSVFNQSQKTGHIYDYPGDYVVVFEYYGNASDSEPKAATRATIKVSLAEVIISNVFGNSVELNNKGKSEIDLGGWLLSADKSFTIPGNTIILAGKKIVLSPEVTRLNIIDKNNLKLLYPNGEVAYVYGSSLEIIEEKPKAKAESIIAKDETKPITEQIQTEQIQIEQTESEKQSLSASAIKSIPAGDSKSIYLAGLAGLIIIGIGSVFLLRKKSKPDIPEAGGLKADDFEITE